jgi:hypothetical protein
MWLVRTASHRLGSFKDLPRRKSVPLFFSFSLHLAINTIRPHLLRSLASYLVVCCDTFVAWLQCYTVRLQLQTLAGIKTMIASDTMFFYSRK